MAILLVSVTTTRPNHTMATAFYFPGVTPRTYEKGEMYVNLPNICWHFSLAFAAVATVIFIAFVLSLVGFILGVRLLNHIRI